MYFKPIKKIDFYIIGKFLGTYFLTIMLIVSISVVFDLSENIDDFIENEAPAKAVLLNYYFNFIPYFANLFSGLFTFIAVIFVTSKMAYNSEIIAILSSGVSFRRLVQPYMLASFVIALLSYSLGNFVIPDATAEMNEFKYTYIKPKKISQEENIHRQIEPGVFIYMRRYNARNDIGSDFTIEKFEDQKLVSKLKASKIAWDREKKIWTIKNYVIRDIDGYNETLTTGNEIDSVIAMQPEEFKTQTEDVETMDLFELVSHINKLKMRGVDAVEMFEIERHRRSAIPFSSFILTLIGVSLASRKMRGGLGLHLGLGILLSFTYIMFQQVTKTFAMSGVITPLLSMWLPNIIFAIVAAFLYKWSAR